MEEEIFIARKTRVEVVYVTATLQITPFSLRLSTPTIVYFSRSAKIFSPLARAAAKLPVIYSDNVSMYVIHWGCLGYLQRHFQEGHHLRNMSVKKSHKQFEPLT